MSYLKQQGELQVCFPKITLVEKPVFFLGTTLFLLVVSFPCLSEAQTPGGGDGPDIRIAPSHSMNSSSSSRA